MKKTFALILSLLLLSWQNIGHAGQPLLTNSILFVTQIPIPGDFTSIGSTFGNQSGDVVSCGRGGDLWIRYPDGTLKNLTRAAGFGVTGDQSVNGIAVRQPCVHWSGAKALFSMVIGGPRAQYKAVDSYWQMYEITNFTNPNATPVITKIPQQPTNYNNISPIYGTDDKIIFTSDRPRNGDRNLYPQRDEYEEAPTVTGLWSLDPVTGKLFMLNHTPSGAFSPSLDSFGRVIFTRWDHLQRDQQADADNDDNGQSYGTFNFTDETANALMLANNRTEVFPDPRYPTNHLYAFTFNQFFPWQINEDGTAEETINHIGRHEIGGSYVAASFDNDPNIHDLYDFSGHYNTNIVENFLQIMESPVTPGLFYGVAAQEFYTHAAGQLVTLTGATNVNPDFMRIAFLTPQSTAYITDGSTPPPDHTGFYRNPLPMSDGRLVCVHTATTTSDSNDGSRAAPLSRYDFRLKTLIFTNGYYQPDQLLTPGITNTASWFDPDVLVVYSNTVLWELDPVEVRARTRPARRVETVDIPEQAMFAAAGVNISDLQNYLVTHNLALIISRNVTTRDHADQQQPYNLKVPGGAQTLGAGGKIYDIQFLQLFQADQIRGVGLIPPNTTPKDGRRVLAQYLHDPIVDNPPAAPTDPTGSVKIASDGSVAAFVPARRAMSWQLTDPTGAGVVKERYWITFQPGEIRTCNDCHGVNERDQSGQPTATNAPLALRDLLRYWKSQYLPVAQVQNNGGTNYLAVGFSRRLAATNLTYTVEVSSNLTTWLDGSTYSAAGSTPNTTYTSEVSHSGTNTQKIVVRDNKPLTTGTNRFMRVRVSAP